MIQAYNTAVGIDLNGTAQAPITMTVGLGMGARRVFMTLDQASEIAARLSNLVDAIKRGE